MAPTLFLHARRLDLARASALDWFLAILGAILAFLVWPGLLD